MDNFAPYTAGVFHGLEESIYRAAPGVSNTSLKEMDRSPAHYLHALQTPWETTAAQVVGHITHVSILEPWRTGLHVVRPEGLSFQTKDGKAWRDSQTVPIITQAEADAISGMVRAVQSHPIARAILEKSDKEVSCFKPDDATGLFLKGRADMVFLDNDDRMTICDLKTCDDARPGAFAKDAAKWAYHRQAAYYMDLFGASQFIFICVEKEAPHGVTVLQYDAEAIQAGREIYRRNLDTLAECQRLGEWPAYSQEITPISIPAYLRRGGL